MFFKNHGVLSTIQLRVWGFCPRWFCPWGFCPRGFCPRGVLSVSRYSRVSTLRTSEVLRDVMDRGRLIFVYFVQLSDYRIRNDTSTTVCMHEHAPFTQVGINKVNMYIDSLSYALCKGGGGLLLHVNFKLFQCSS